MREIFNLSEIPEHLQEFFQPVGGGTGVGDKVVAHPT